MPEPTPPGKGASQLLNLREVMRRTSFVALDDLRADVQRELSKARPRRHARRPLDRDAAPEPGRGRPGRRRLHAGRETSSRHVARRARSRGAASTFACGDSVDWLASSERPRVCLTTVCAGILSRSGPVKNGAADYLTGSRQIMQECTYELCSR